MWQGLVELIIFCQLINTIISSPQSNSCVFDIDGYAICVCLSLSIYTYSKKPTIACCLLYFQSWWSVHSPLKVLFTPNMVSQIINSMFIHPRNHGKGRYLIWKEKLSKYIYIYMSWLLRVIENFRLIFYEIYDRELYTYIGRYIVVWSIDLLQWFIGNEQELCYGFSCAKWSE